MELPKGYNIKDHGMPPQIHLLWRVALELQGFYYIVNVAGSTNLNGITDWEVGDWAIFSTTGVWQRLDQTGVQGTGTTGTLTKWATGSTISDSIVSESGNGFDRDGIA